MVERTAQEQGEYLSASSAERERMDTEAAKSAIARKHEADKAARKAANHAQRASKSEKVVEEGLPTGVVGETLAEPVKRVVKATKKREPSKNAQVKKVTPVASAKAKKHRS